jgi:hypothetical protein
MIPALSADALLRLWEQGRTEHPVDRALTMLAHALPSVPRRDLAALTIGERDRLLLGLRVSHLGSALRLVGRCESCKERLEVELDAAELAATPVPAWGHELRCGDLELRLRQPNSHDLAWAAQHEGPEVIGGLLLRCVAEARRGDEAVDAAALDASVLQAVERSLADADPLGDVVLRLTCDACHVSFDVPFDVAESLWTELSASARRLFAEVHTLASSYAWSEADILRMSAARRHAYLELIGGSA